MVAPRVGSTIWKAPNIKGANASTILDRPSILLHLSHMHRKHLHLPPKMPKMNTFKWTTVNMIWTTFPALSWAQKLWNWTTAERFCISETDLRLKSRLRQGSLKSDQSLTQQRVQQMLDFRCLLGERLDFNSSQNATMVNKSGVAWKYRMFYLTSHFFPLLIFPISALTSVCNRWLC